MLFFADDIGVTDIGPYGNRAVRTSYVDQLAKESVIFTLAFATSPIYSTSRKFILTGMMPFRKGGHANHSVLKKY